MTNDSAAEILKGLVFTLQRMRSILAEGGCQETGLLDWVMGDLCPLPALAKLLDAYRRHGRVAPLDLHNMLIVATVLEPSIEAAYEINRRMGLMDAPLLPTPEMALAWLQEQAEVSDGKERRGYRDDEC